MSTCTSKHYLISKVSVNQAGHGVAVDVVQVAIVRVSKNGRKQQLTVSVCCKVRLVRQAARTVDVVHRWAAHEGSLVLFSTLEPLGDVSDGVSWTLEARSGHGRGEVRNLGNWQLVLCNKKCDEVKLISRT